MIIKNEINSERESYLLTAQRIVKSIIRRNDGFVKRKAIKTLENINTELQKITNDKN